MINYETDKFLFMDIDGVWNSSESYMVNPNADLRTNEGFGAKECALIHWMLTQTKAHIVMNSKWNDTHSLEDFRNKVFNGLITPERIIAKTDTSLHFDNLHSKAYAIDKYIRENKIVITNCIIIDDEKIPRYLIAEKDHFLQTIHIVRPSFVTGISLMNLKEIEAHLEESWDWPDYVVRY